MTSDYFCGAKIQTFFETMPPSVKTAIRVYLLFFLALLFVLLN